MGKEDLFMSSRGKIALVIAGGQIGMRFNEQMNSWQPVITPEEMLEWLPGETAGKIFTVDWSHQPSSHYSVRMTADLVQVLSKTVVDGADGIVVTCGTDTLEEMAYLADLYWAYPQPLVFTASIYPYDMPGSDAHLNLTQAVQAAFSKECWGLGVLVCVQEQLFAASEITEIASQRQDAFAAPGRGPLAQFIGDKVDIIRQYKRSKVLEGSMTPARDVELLSVALGGGERLLEILSSDEKRELDGLVIAGFGNGHVPPSWIPRIKKLLKDDVPVVITTRCPEGYTREIPYSFEGSMSRLLEMGVLQGGSLRPAQARLKLAAGLGAGLRRSDLQQYLLEK
jgi:L-asparaginase